LLAIPALHRIAMKIKPPGPSSILCRAVFLFLLCGVLSAGGLDRDLYYANNKIALQNSLNNESTLAERLLVKSMGTTDAVQFVRIMQSISDLDGAAWIKQEALESICAYYCINEKIDSLEIYSERLNVSRGSYYDCPLVSQTKSCWTVQIGAFSSEVNAAKALRVPRLAGLSGRVYYNRKHYLALLGCFSGKREARKFAKECKEKSLIKDYKFYKVED
jgi:hypothetical protein